jgi:hypothetical protein
MSLGGVNAKNQAGDNGGQRVPFGYAHDREERTVEVDPKKGRLVKLVFNNYGTRTHSIASLRNATGM